MKKYTSIILVALCILFIAGCSKNEHVVSDTPNTMVPSIIFEGNLYRTTGKEIPAEVDESAIVGEISSIVPLTQLPTKEGEANFGQTGDQLAITSNGLLVKMNHEWVVFELSEAGITDGAPLAPVDSDLDLESVSHLEVMSGLTGQKITIKDADSVQKVMDDIESLRYEKKNAVEEVGYAYRIRFYNENYDELGRIFITEENGHQISYDGYYYLVEADQNINVDYLEEMLKDAPPAEPGDEGNDEITDIGPKKPENNEICGYPTTEDMGADKYGITLILENLTSTGATIKCEQSGGEVTGELETGSWYIVEKWTQMDGWKEVETVIAKQQVGWTSEAYMILEDSTSEWEVNWEWLYGKLPVGKYRIGKQIMDWRSSGDYDTVVYYALFEIK